MEASDLLFEVFLLLPGPHFSNTSGCVGTVTVNGKAHCPTWVHEMANVTAQRQKRGTSEKQEAENETGCSVTAPCPKLSQCARSTTQTLNPIPDKSFS